MSDTIAENLEQKIQTKPKWNVPCVFERLFEIPLDSKSCFQTYNALLEYIESPQSTAYPGMYVAVIHKDDPKAGPYILMSDGSSLHPIPLGLASDDVEHLQTLDKDEGYSLEDVGDLLNNVVDILKSMKRN